MGYFVFSGKRKISLDLRADNAAFLHRQIRPLADPSSAVDEALTEFFSKNRKRFLDKKILVVIPDGTRAFHPGTVLPLLSRHLKKVCKEADFMIALGFHRKLSVPDLRELLGKEFFKNHRVLQHNPAETRFLGNIKDIPLYLNRALFKYDALFTVGEMEPHLYAGISGGVKCISIGLAGKKTILSTHSSGFLSRRGVYPGNTGSNPFQQFLWYAADRLKMEVYSLNIVNNPEKQMTEIFADRAKTSFNKAVLSGKRLFQRDTKGRFDIALVGCDYPKDGSLYQASRLFNYATGRNPVVADGGAVFVFAGLAQKAKSDAERNFENLLKRESISPGYKFAKPGEHRAFKVMEAQRDANVGFITARPLDLPRILCFRSYRDALRWSSEKYGRDFTVAGIPSGFYVI